MNLEKIPLKTVRQFSLQDVVLADYEDAFTPETPQVMKKVEDLCYAKVRFQTSVRTTSVITTQQVSSLLFVSALCSSSHSVGRRDVGRRRERTTRVSAHPRKASHPPEGELGMFASSAKMMN